MFNGKSVLITGGTGSFGRRCVQMILAKYKPKRLIVFSRDEYKQFQMQQEFNGAEMRYFLGDIRDEPRAAAMWKVDYVSPRRRFETGARGENTTPWNLSRPTSAGRIM